MTESEERTMTTRTRSRRRRRGRRAIAGAALVVLTLTACGEDGGITVPTALPTERPTLPTLPEVTLPTVTLPTVTLPTVTLPTPTLPTVTLPGASPDAPAETPAPETSAPETPAPETPADTATPEPEATEDEVVAAAPEDEAEDEDEEGGSGWWWLLLLLVAAGVAFVVVGLVRRRRDRAEWAGAVDESLHEAAWLRDTLVPNLLSQGPDARAGIWAVGQPRVLALEQALTDLLAQAPDDVAGRRVTALSAPVSALRRTLDQGDTLPDFGGARTVAALQQSQFEIDEAVRSLQSPVADDPRAPAATG